MFSIYILLSNKKILTLKEKTNIQDYQVRRCKIVSSRLKFEENIQKKYTLSIYPNRIISLTDFVRMIL